MRVRVCMRTCKYVPACVRVRDGVWDVHLCMCVDTNIAKHSHLAAVRAAKLLVVAVEKYL